MQRMGEIFLDDSSYTAQLRCLREKFGFDFASLAMVLEVGRPLLTWVYATGNKNTRYRRIVLEPGKGIAGGVYRTGHAMVLQNAYAELSEKEHIKYPITLAEELMSVLAFPLWREERVQGVLLLAFRIPDRITRQLFDDVVSEIAPSFCHYEVKPVRFDQAIRVGETGEIDSVPVYELLNYHILRAQEEECRRISRDLHDSIVQELIGVQMLLRTMKYQPDQERMLQIAQQAEMHINQVQNELRNILTVLRPLPLDSFGLAAAFRSYFSQMEQRHKVTVRFSENIGERRFSREQEIIFYRVCQEAVLNSCKYSGCSEVAVSLLESQGYLTLEVTDHGVGFDPEHMDVKGTGMGLLGMADRAELIDGELTFQTAPGKGVSIWITAPVKEGEHA